MLSKEKRINLKKDFKWITSGKKLETKFLKLFLIMGSNDSSKVGIATSSTIFRKSSERNRARRLTSAAFESLYSQLPSRINIVALPKRSVISVKSGDVLMDLGEALKRYHVIPRFVRDDRKSK